MCCKRCFQSKFTNNEDAFQYCTALHNNMDLISTRNKKDYKTCTVAMPVYTSSVLSNTINTQ